MRVPIDKLTLPEKAAALNTDFRRECMSLGAPIYDAGGKIIGVDIGRIPLQQLFHKYMLRFTGYRTDNLPPMFLDLQPPQFIPTLPPDVFKNAPKTGVGAELKQVLNEYGTAFSEIYDFLMYKLNEKPVDECAQHIDDILDVLEDEAYRNKYAFERDRVEIMVRLAIRRARRKQNG
jgi:hypothetical protein